jgi:hypothetical protein|tara:strand:+ start:2201 stop:2857 length:657 start_codon:yes stop_codon:yes gene_type:complete
MVSLNTLFTLGIIGAGLLAFTSLGGAGGIGQRIGGGFKAFQDNLIGGFTGALNPFGAAATGEPLINLQLSDDPSRYTDPAIVEKNLQNAIDMNTGQPIGTSPQLPDPYDSKTGGGQVDTSPTPQATPIQTTQEPKVESGIPNQGGGVILFSPKPNTYFERITQYVAQPLTTLTPSQAAKQNISRSKQDYGGYGSANQQNQTLQNLLAVNAQKYGEYFS